MDAHSSYPKASALLVGALVLLSLQDAGAQTTQTTADPPVPGWGIALLVMLSLMTALALGGLIFLPLWCRNTQYDSQDGIAFYSPRTMCQQENLCNVQCTMPCNDPCNDPCNAPCNVPCSVPCNTPCDIPCDPPCDASCSARCEPLPDECQSQSQTSSYRM